MLKGTFGGSGGVANVGVPMIGNMSTFSGAQATKGFVFTPNSDITIKGMSAIVTVAAAGTYRMKICQIDGGNAITAVEANELFVAAANASLLYRQFMLPAPLILTAGVRRAMFCCRTDGAANFGLEVLGTGTGIIAVSGMPAITQYCNQGSVVDPGIGATLTVGGGPYYGGFVI